MRIYYVLFLGVLLLPAKLVLAQNSVSLREKPSSRELAGIYQQKALELGNGNISAALSYADSLEEIARKLKDDQFLYNAHKIKGDLYRKTGDYNLAFFWLQQALNGAEDVNDTLGMVKAHNNLGNVYKNTGALDKALENYLMTLQLGKKSLHPGQKATVLMNIGQVHEELDQLSEALSYYLQALQLIEKEAHPFDRALVHTNLGALFSKENKKEKALEHLKMARNLFEELGNEIRLAEVLNEFSLVYLKDNPEISVEYLNLAEKLYRKNRNKAGLFEVHKNAGEAFTRLGNYKFALDHLLTAQSYSDSLQNRFLKGEVFLKLAHLNEQQQNYEEATLFYNQYLALDQSLNRNKLVRNITRAQQGFEMDQQEEKIQALEGKLKDVASGFRMQRLMIGFLAALSFIFAGTAAWAGLKFRKSRRLNSLLKSRNHFIQTQKAEIKGQHELIAAKKLELEEARKASENYLAELSGIKEQLEEKVMERTKELEEAYRKLSFHINNTPLAVLEWNDRQELNYWPKQAEAIFGYTAEEMLGLKIDEVPFIQPDDRSEVLEVVEQLCRGSFSRQYLTRKSMHRFGAPIYVEWSFSVLLNSDGELESILSIANDVTLREQNYRELKSANQELDTFLYKSSHDLRGPIARMQGIINLGLLESKDPEAQLYFGMLNKVTDELNHLLLRLLMVHNINQHDYKEEKLLFADFVDKLVATHTRNRSSLQEVKIRNKVRKDLIISSDGTLLGILLVNLLENALTFTDNFNPTVEVDAEYLPSGKYVIHVMDNGVGIPAEYQEKVFDMFFQGSTRSTGTGLGLYMARKAVKKLGGDIKLSSREGHTLFEIILPAQRAVEPQKVNILN